MKIDKVKAIGLIIALLFLLQLLLYGIKQCLFFFVPRTDYSDHMASMFAMVVITTCFVVIARKFCLKLSVFPQKFSRTYIGVSAVAAVLLVATPSNFNGGIQSVSLLFYSSIATPVFEELIFRGYVWNKLNSVFPKEWKTYVVSTVLFAIWHIGYIGSIAFRISEGLVTAMIWKVITGMCFGIVLGAIRLKTKNCYSTMLLHGVMNMFGR